MFEVRLDTPEKAASEYSSQSLGTIRRRVFGRILISNDSLQERANQRRSGCDDKNHLSKYHYFHLSAPKPEITIAFNVLLPTL